MTTQQIAINAMWEPVGCLPDETGNEWCVLYDRLIMDGRIVGHIEQLHEDGSVYAWSYHDDTAFRHGSYAAVDAARNAVEEAVGAWTGER